MHLRNLYLPLALLEETLFSTVEAVRCRLTPCFRPGCRTWERASRNKEGEEGTSWPPCPDLVVTLILMDRNFEMLF